MGIETTTTVTCDECGLDITNEPTAHVTISTAITSPPAEPDPENPMLTPFTPPPVLESRTVVLCEAHAKPAQAKLAKIAPAK